MIEVTVNGKSHVLPDRCTVAELVAEVVVSSKGVAVAIDREVIPRSSWTVTSLQPGQLNEIVTAAAGG